MAWAKSTTTKHTCTPDGKALPFGRLAPAGECPRCDERRNGAPAVQWPNYRTRAQRDAIACAEITDHYRSENHKRGIGCGGPTYCTYGEW